MHTSSFFQSHTTNQEQHCQTVQFVVEANIPESIRPILPDMLHIDETDTCKKQDARKPCTLNLQPLILTLRPKLNHEPEIPGNSTSSSAAGRNEGSASGTSFPAESPENRQGRAIPTAHHTLGHRLQTKQATASLLMQQVNRPMHGPNFGSQKCDRNLHMFPSWRHCNAALRITLPNTYHPSNLHCSYEPGKRPYLLTSKTYGRCEQV